MALADREVRQTTVNDGAVTETTRQINDPVVDREHRSNVAERVVWLIAGILLALLAVRFLFALLGANPNNGLANFVYSITHPFVSPFFNLFSYDEVTAGRSSVEFFTLVAMLIYGLVAWGISRLLTIRRP
ncbi:MAG: rane protein of unknown function [Candidatus Saccharibacteria bacterium]|nr:rane protein of unknown function [Candidatus Saccharibacteria bacterium]